MHQSSRFAAFKGSELTRLWQGLYDKREFADREGLPIVVEECNALMQEIYASPTWGK